MTGPGGESRRRDPTRAGEFTLRRHSRGFLGHPCGKVLVCYLVAATALLGALPQEGGAALAPTTLPAAERGTGRAEDLARIQSLLEQQPVAQRLAELGWPPSSWSGSATLSTRS